MSPLFGKSLPDKSIVRPATDGKAVNDASDYDVAVRSVVVPPGKKVWRIVRVHHLTPAENKNQHALYVRLIDERNQPVKTGGVQLDWGQGWQDIDLDPEGPFALVYPLAWGTVYRVRVQSLLSDEVIGIHTYHREERKGNKQGHHSFAVTWQRKVPSVAVDNPVVPSSQPVTTAKLLPRFAELTAMPAKTVQGEEVPVHEKEQKEIIMPTTQIAPSQGKPIPHYVLFGRPFSQGVRAHFALAMDYLLHFKLSFGFNNIDAACLAKRVTIIANEESFMPEDEQQLRQEGCEVERLDLPPGELLQVLQQRMEKEQSFID